MNEANSQTARLVSRRCTVRNNAKQRIGKRGRIASHAVKDPVRVPRRVFSISSTFTLAVDGRYNNDGPFLNFLVNKYVRQEYKDMIDGIKFPVEMAIFCVDLTPTDCHSSVGIRRLVMADKELQTRIRSAKDETYRVIDRRQQHSTKSPESQIFIQVIGYESLESLYVRYIPLDLKSECFEFGKDPSGPRRDIIDVLFSSIDFPGDLWTYVRQDGKRVHMFDCIDDYVRALPIGKA